MIQNLLHNFRLWTIGIILVGLLFIATQCSPTNTPIAQKPPPEDRPPEIIGFTHDPSGPVSPNASIMIQVNVDGHGHKIDNYQWVVVGEGNIVSGQGTSLITYEVPKIPGSYEVRVKLEYEGGAPVEDSTKVEVVPESTPPPTEEPTAEPTVEPIEAPTKEPAPEPPTPTPEPPTPPPTPDAVVKAEALNVRSGPGTDYDIRGALKQGDCLNIKCKCPDSRWLEVTCPSKGLEGWVNASLLEINLPLASVAVATATPTPKHTPTPIVTPTPTLLPPPILTEPENGAAFIGEPALFKWQWDRPRAPDEVFSVRVHREGETRLCHHDQARDLEYKGSLSYCTAGTHYWGVTLARRLCADETNEHCWQSLSEPSEERWFYYVPSEEPWKWPEPPSGEEAPGEQPFNP